MFLVEFSGTYVSREMWLLCALEISHKLDLTLDSIKKKIQKKLWHFEMVEMRERLYAFSASPQQIQIIATYLSFSSAPLLSFFSLISLILAYVSSLEWITYDSNLYIMHTTAYFNR